LYRRLGWPQDGFGLVLAKRNSITPTGDRTFLKGKMEGMIKVMGGRERRNKTSLNDLKKK